MKISVLGCGRWGSFIAWYLNGIGHEVMLYGRNGSKKLEQLIKTRENGLIRLPEQVYITDGLEESLHFADTVIISISSQALRSFFEKISKLETAGKTFVLCMKGIEQESGKRLSEVAGEFTDRTNTTAVWVGPGHVQDFVRGIPNCMVIDCESDKCKKELVDAFSGDLIRFYYGTDLLGNEVGAASKNVIGIAAGMLDGLNRTSLKGALMSRGTREIARLIRAMGGNEMTAYGLSHLGDYEATVFSQYSHNRSFGESFVKGEPYHELAEGVTTVKALMKLSKMYQAELPICTAVHRVLFEGEDPHKVLAGLFLRSLKDEF